MKYVHISLIMVLWGIANHQAYAVNEYQDLPSATQEYYNKLAVVDELVRTQQSSEVRENGIVYYQALSGSKISEPQLRSIVYEIEDFGYFRKLIDKHLATNGQEGKSMETLQDGTPLLWFKQGDSIRLLSVERYNQLNDFFDRYRQEIRETAVNKEFVGASKELIQSIMLLNQAAEPLSDNDFKRLAIELEERLSWFDWFKKIFVR